MAMQKLTPKQEKFCQCIADGMNQSDAYRASYNSSKMSDRILWVRACEVASNSKVSARITELKASLAKKQLWTREMSVKILSSIALKSASGDNNKIAAIRELNLMHGFNAPGGDDDYVLPVNVTIQVKNARITG